MGRLHTKNITKSRRVVEQIKKTKGSERKMPYIESDREEIDELIISHSKLWFKKGRLNYFICRVWKLITASNGVSYDDARKMIGELECAKLEIYRRWIVPHEDKAKERNGDV